MPIAHVFTLDQKPAAISGFAASFLNRVARSRGAVGGVIPLHRALFSPPRHPQPLFVDRQGLSRGRSVLHALWLRDDACLLSGVLPEREGKLPQLSGRAYRAALSAASGGARVVRRDRAIGAASRLRLDR